MARIARVVAPGIPHHVTQRGNRRQQTFFNDEDYQSYTTAHMKVQDDILVKTKPLLEMVNNPWKDFLAFDAQEPEIELFRKHERCPQNFRNSKNSVCSPLKALIINQNFD